ncbi:MAG: hypothetical protein C0392_00005, partial [Syntrophus sp. (in: bacteria)]|nr:hypothetical protein [Syntrophus sp. (in: bacteria)]
MTNVLVSGLSVGTEVGVCEACGFDYEWLLRYPSVILWVDKILLTKRTWDDVLHMGGPTESPFYRSVALIFQLLHSSGLVEVVDAGKVFSTDINDAIICSVENDIEALVSQFPEAAKLGDGEKVPGQIFIQGDEYCSPYLYSVYASLL